MLLLATLATAYADPAAAVDLLVQHRDKRALPSAPALERSVYERALAGEVPTGLIDVEGHKTRLAWGVGVSSQPIDRYWAAVNDDRNKQAYTKLEHVELLKGDYCGADRVVFQYLGVPMLTDRWWVVDQAQNGALSGATGGRVREMSWKSRKGFALTESAQAWADKGMELPFSEGSWTLTDLGDGRTLVEYYAWSDPGGNIPARMASSFAAGGISDTIASMEALAKKGPSCL